MLKQYPIEEFIKVVTGYMKELKGGEVEEEWKEFKRLDSFENVS